MKVGIFKRALCKVVSPLLECFMRMDSMFGGGILPLISIVKPKLVGKVLIEATVRKIRVEGIKVVS